MKTQILTLLLTVFSLSILHAEIFEYQWNKPEFQNIQIEHAQGDMVINKEKLGKLPQSENPNVYLWKSKNWIVEVSHEGYILISDQKDEILTMGTPKGEKFPFKYY